MPASKPAFLHSATQSVDDRLGHTFSFLWATYAGLKELWWQVRGFRGQFPKLHIKQIEEKFVFGLEVPGGIDFQHLFLETEWSNHEQGFAKWLLFDACTLYEGWVEKVCRDLFGSNDCQKTANALQFPAGTKNGKATGYVSTIAAANSSKSALMSTQFFPVLKASKLNCWPYVDDHLVAYRYFKECRNAIIHSDGHATQEILDWHARLTALQAKVPTPFRHRFALPAHTLEEPLKLDLNDCVLLATVVRRLICTFDAAMSVSATSEKLLEQRLKRLVSSNPKWNSLPNDPAKRHQRVHRMLAAARIPEPVDLAKVMAWMQSRKLI